VFLNIAKTEELSNQETQKLLGAVGTLDLMLDGQLSLVRRYLDGQL
jgi:hypothetical protein